MNQLFLGKLKPLFFKDFASIISEFLVNLCLPVFFSSKGLNSIPQIEIKRASPLKNRQQFLQPNESTMTCCSGASPRAPKLLPDVAIPVAKERFLSKQQATITSAGRQLILVPNPTMTPWVKEICVKLFAKDDSKRPRLVIRPPTITTRLQPNRSLKRLPGQQKKKRQNCAMDPTHAVEKI